jgi:hypothetical protein
MKIGRYARHQLRNAATINPIAHQAPVPNMSFFKKEKKEKKAAQQRSSAAA